jgi:hypothetical protein
MQAEKVDVNSTLFNCSFISPSGEMSWLFSSSCLREDVMTGGISAQLLEPLDSKGFPPPGAACTYVIAGHYMYEASYWVTLQHPIDPNSELTCVLQLSAT